MGAVRLFRVYLDGELSFLFRQLGRGKKQLRGRCNLLVRVFKRRKLISFFYSFIYSFHVLFRRSSIYSDENFSAQAVPETGLCTIREQRQLAFFFSLESILRSTLQSAWVKYIF